MRKPTRVVRRGAAERSLVSGAGSPLDPRGQAWGGAVVALAGGDFLEGRYDGAAMPPAALRQLASFFFVAIVVETILTHVREFAYPQQQANGVGYVVRLRDRKRAPSRAEQKLIDTVTEELFWCGLLRDEEERLYRETLPTYLFKVGYDSLVLDRDFTEFVPDRAGLPAMFRALDGASARFAIDRETGYRYPVQVEVDSLQAVHAWKPYDPDGFRARIGIRRPRTDMRSFGYGYPELEEIRPAIFGMMRSLETSFAYFTHGLSGAGVLAFDDRTPPEQLNLTTSYMRAMATGSVNRGRLAVLTYPDGKQPVFIPFAQATLKDMEFVELFRTMVKATCGGFKVDPAIIGMQFGNEGQTAALSQGSGRERIDYAREKGVWSLARHLIKGIDNYWIRPRYPDLEVVPGGLDGETEETRNKLNADALKVRTFNEVRARQDDPPLDLTKIENPADVPEPLLQAWLQVRAMQSGQEGEAPDGEQPEMDDEERGAGAQNNGPLFDAMREAAENTDGDEALTKALVTWLDRGISGGRFVPLDSHRRR
jgi:hypothetical protein